MAPLQLSEEVFRVHSARLDEALVTAALYLDACDLKSTCNLNNRSEGASAFLTNLCADSGNWEFPRDRAHAKTNSVALCRNPRFCDCDQGRSEAETCFRASSRRGFILFWGWDARPFPGKRISANVQVLLRSP